MKRTWMILLATMMIADSALAQGRGPGGPGGPGGGRPPGGLGDMLRGLGRGGGGSGDFQQRFQEMARQQGMTFNEAPTLRMSLFEVVQRIGGPKAEAVLLGELNATNRGSEVVELDKLLEKMAGNKHKEAVLMAAHAVLEQESLEPTGFRVDARGNDMLWGLLRKYEDKTFSPQAQAMIVDMSLAKISWKSMCSYMMTPTWNCQMTPADPFVRPPAVIWAATTRRTRLSHPVSRR